MLSTITPSAAIYTVAGATMTEPKAHMRIDSSNTADDAMVELYCTAAQRYIEARARIVFGVAEFRIETRAYQIPLEITKFKSLESVATLDSAGAATTITTGFRLDLSQAVPHLIIDPAVHLEPYAFRVQYKAEEDTEVQTQARAALLLLGAHFYANRESVVTGTIATPVPMGLGMIIDSLSLARL